LHTVVLGGGILGLATARALAAAGAAVTLVEQGPLPNPLASSYDAHRLIREVYGDSDGYCRMVADAFAAWERLWENLGTRHYVETGALAISDEPGDWTDRSARTLDRVGIPWERLDAAELRRRFSLLAVDDGAWGVFTRRGGVLLADRILHALTRDVADRGVTLHAGVPAVEIDPERARIRLADGRVLSGDRLVAVVGAWTVKLLPRLDTRFRPHRQALAYVEAPAEHARRWKRMPILVDLGGPNDLYVVPPVAGTGLKFGAGAHKRPGDPDAPRIPEPGEGERILARFQGRIAALDRYRTLRLQLCHYMIAPDRRFVVEAMGPTLAVSACSGHGFKFGALLGERIAETILSGVDPAPLSRWAAGY
jgi:glycine/D-amino acid oxidase-like deaminating enzyme